MKRPQIRFNVEFEIFFDSVVITWEITQDYLR